MKFTAFITLLCLTTSWGAKDATENTEDKGKRELALGYPSSNSYQTPSLNQDDGSAVSIGAGYSIGAKPNFGYSEHGSGAALQLSSEGLPSSGHASIQLAPITLQPNHGGFASGDLSQLMSQISQGLNSGAITLQSPNAHEGIYQVGAAQAAHGGQELSFPQFSYGAPKLQQYALVDQFQGGVPSYAIGTKGLSTYTSNGPVLFNPSDAQAGQQPVFNIAQIAQSFSDAGALGDSQGHAFASQLGGSGHSLGAHFKAGGNYGAPIKGNFKPSAFLGSSMHSDSHHGLTGYYSPSFGGSSNSHGSLSLGSGGHSVGNLASYAGFGGSPSKHIAASYLPAKSGAFGGSTEALAALSAGAGHSHPGNGYGIPSGSYQATASSMPHYYVASKQASPSGFGEGSSAYKGHAHGPISAFSAGPKYSFGGHSRHSVSGNRYGAPAKDAHGAYSEPAYNTIKYSEELKPYSQ